MSYDLVCMPTLSRSLIRVPKFWSDSFQTAQTLAVDVDTFFRSRGAYKATAIALCYLDALQTCFSELSLTAGQIHSLHPTPKGVDAYLLTALKDVYLPVAQGHLQSISQRLNKIKNSLSLSPAYVKRTPPQIA
ncbi:MAG: hypothetical protein ACD_17C00395G0002 [uncultured bacterium]|nr:MAG: hypothetical protein ACD_17C00395G0002 [uncultured bacterium]OGN56575.1 MAG: hypothetical protein A2796_01735 [Chlamydiae bacterium RIFCSPHIGHO2_01_FULL_44_39]OGN58480.1 MAG: hypothetical protein A3C42_06280 [Chlamydiae bacterium RIFCSPHIGHO2_02_FULL_45_9]OGN61070.1 MAG: hypothetical protein A3D96_04805 [Chlamydiae bacterium RIFCSPHIGHO2_12_FULL_44_59]OGN66876.1 MAG: hypothetical protein A2978_01745 [Chlamydiae bacterium RIFCSPLOWO2_01_FULL_44_52]OGN68899.1 MAG: hypothetical protein A3